MSVRIWHIIGLILVIGGFSNCFGLQLTEGSGIDFDFGSMSLFNHSQMIGYQQTDITAEGEITPGPLIKNPWEEKQKLYMRFYFWNGTMLATGLDFFITRSLWAGINFGFTFLPLYPALGRPLYIFAPSLDIGWFFIGNVDTNFRMGINFTSMIYFTLPADLWEQFVVWVNGNFSSGNGVVLGNYLVLEWKFLYIRFGIRSDFRTEKLLELIPSIGIRF